ncbi:MAG: selenium metabolism-associated LysR family transcriptional regulator [Coriobacteriia bacterium]
MNLAQLRAFLAVVEHGSFSAAAKALGLSQPAVTQQIQALEATLGVTVFDRHYRRVDLTEQGKVLLPYARSITEKVDEALLELERLSDEVSGHLHVAASTTPGQYVLPSLLGRFREQYPRVGLSLVVHDTAEVLDAVESREADMGMTGARMKGRQLEFEEMGSDKLLLIAPPDWPVAKEKGVGLDDVARLPFVIREEGSGTRKMAEESFVAAGHDPNELNVVVELGTNEAVVTAVEGGLGVAVVSGWAAQKALQLGTVAQVDCAHFPVSRPLWAVIPRRQLTGAAEAFLEFLREAM